jgi:hypothetical protein
MSLYLHTTEVEQFKFEGSGRAKTWAAGSLPVTCTPFACQHVDSGIHQNRAEPSNISFVPVFGHDRDVLDRPFGVKAYTQEAYPQLLTNSLDLFVEE